MKTLSILGIVFVILKLTNVIDWSWWWVLLPFYAGIVVYLLVLSVIGASFLPLLKNKR